MDSISLWFLNCFFFPDSHFFYWKWNASIQLFLSFFKNLMCIPYDMNWQLWVQSCSIYSNSNSKNMNCWKTSCIDLYSVIWSIVFITERTDWFMFTGIILECVGTAFKVNFLRPHKTKSATFVYPDPPDVQIVVPEMVIATAIELLPCNSSFREWTVTGFGGPWTNWPLILFSGRDCQCHSILTKMFESLEVIKHY